MQASRTDFGWRAAWAASFFDEEGDKPVDDIGHSMHVAGIIRSQDEVRAVKTYSAGKARSNAIVVSALELAVKDDAKHAGWRDRQSAAR